MAVVFDQIGMSVRTKTEDEGKSGLGVWINEYTAELKPSGAVETDVVVDLSEGTIDPQAELPLEFGKTYRVTVEEEPASEPHSNVVLQTTGATIRELVEAAISPAIPVVKLKTGSSNTTNNFLLSLAKHWSTDNSPYDLSKTYELTIEEEV